MTPMQLLVKTLKDAKAAKQEEEERKRKEEEESKKLTSMQQMAQAIKAARAAKLEEQRRAEEQAKHKEEMQTAPLINIRSMATALMKAKDEITHHDKNGNLQSQFTNLQDLADNQIKQTIWNDVKTTANNKRMDLSTGIGLALLSKAMGVHKIENKYMRHIDNIRKTKLMNRMEMRIRVQNKIL